MKIGILGGTFNPPHLGHRLLCDIFQKELSFDKILIIPTYIPPHKEAVELADTFHRLKMCELSFSDIENSEICTVEIERKGKSYTFDTLTLLKKKYPDAEFYFLMGSDMFSSFKQWYRYDDIIKMCKICTCERYQNDDNKNLYPEYKDRIIYSSISPFEVSSSEIREKIKKGEDVSQLVKKDVLDYIQKEEIYDD